MILAILDYLAAATSMHALEMEVSVFAGGSDGDHFEIEHVSLLRAKAQLYDLLATGS